MAYDFRPFQKPVVNNQQAMSTAKSKCGVWGYNDAEAFGGQSIDCFQRDGWGNCTTGRVIVQYQCIGNLDARHPVAPAPVAAPVASNQPLLANEYKQRQLGLLMQQNLPYDEYSRRYQQIMGNR